MRRTIKWVGIMVGVIVGLAVLAMAGLYLYAGFQLNRTYSFPVESVVIPGGPAALARGRQLAMVHCATCHGDDLAGTVIFEDASLGRIAAPNLTSGRGGLGSQLNDADYIRAIRHGVGRNGRALIVMPSRAFYYLSDEDLGALVAYAKAVPPLDHGIGERVVMTPLARILIGAGAFGDIFAAAGIDHSGPRPVAPAPGDTVVYGDYLVRVGECRTCHGDNLTGGKDPNPQAPPAPNLTQSGELGAWSEQDFIRTIRTGTTPAGRHVTEYMPWKYIGQMTDGELRAIWMYLKSQRGRQ